jgi:hypothetical protein
MLDAKAEVDTVLRQAITDFTAQFVNRMLDPIKSKDGKPLKISPVEAANRTTALRQNITQQTPFLRAKLEDYITDHRTREMLVAAVIESITQTYEDWYETSYTPSLNGAGGARSTKGKGSVDSVWDPVVFEEWCGSVFKVGTLGLGIGLGDGEDEEDRGFNGDGSESGSVNSVSVRTGTERTGGHTGLRIKM